MKRIPVTVLALAFLALVALATGCWEPICPLGEEPIAIIDKPPLQHAVMQSYGEVIRFEWHVDPDCRPMSVRYFCMLVLDSDTFPIFDPTTIIDDLNEHPKRYEDQWSDWVRYNAPDGAGRGVTIPDLENGTMIGDDEVLDGPLKIGALYLFAVQARSYCDHVTTTFELNVNTRFFIPREVAGPLLTVREPLLGHLRFVGTGMDPVSYDLPPGVPLNFGWEADASEYGGEILCYRYGWDVLDINNPNAWAVPCGPSYTTAPEHTFHSGAHTLHVEAVDNANNVTRGEIRINIIPFPMDRTLLWVDDFFTTDPQSPLYEMPGESNHDAFWTDICSRAERFVPERDVYDCYYDHNVNPPTMQDIARYKNIIWTYSSALDAWHDVVLFIPESEIGCCPRPTKNYLPLFLAKGGHLWTLGRSDHGGGLAALWKPSTLPLWPATFEHDLAVDPEDESVFDCMAYRDYCVTAIDKIWGPFKTDPSEVPPGYNRSFDRDALLYAYRDADDPVTGQYPGLPERIDLWEEVTKPGRFFDPRMRGLIYCEIYDPAFYMDYHNLTSQDCFHPIYRMRARSSISVTHNQTIAVWITNYEDITPEVVSGIGVPARSVHFGFPLWFFDRTAIDQIVDVIFEEWGILTGP